MRDAGDDDTMRGPGGVLGTSARFRTYVERGPHAIFLVDGEGRYIDANPAACRLLGHTHEELCVLSIADISIDEPSLEALSMLKRDRWLAIEKRVRRKDGKAIVVSIDGVTVEPGRYLAFVTDVTRLREDEEALRRERDRARDILDTVEAIILELDREGRISLINRKGCEILGYAEEELLGRSWFDSFIPRAERAEVRAVFARTMAGEEAAAVERFSNAVLNRQGELREIDWHNRILLDESGKPAGCLSAGQDVTDQRKLEAELLQSRKLESIGTLAGGIAHDMNNVLATIYALSIVAERMLEETHPARGHVGTMGDTAKRGGALVRNLLGFARRGHFERRLSTVSEVVGTATGLLEPALPKTVELSIVERADLAPVLLDTDQVAQVLVNLCLNAADAMAGAGTITITTRDEALTRGEVPNLMAGRYARIDVTDTGEGMSEEVRERAFEPFFTTKDVGRGTGLGLSMAYGVVRRHHGAIALDSTVGEGTRVTVWLPLAAEGEEDIAEPTPAASEPADRSGVAAATHTILLVDDEVALRTAMSQILAQFGCSVIDTGEATKAIELFRERGAEVDLVMLDMSMPEMTGLECLRRLREIDRTVPVVICTGYVEDEATRKALEQPAVIALGKPFTPDGLRDAVRGAIDAASEDR